MIVGDHVLVMMSRIPNTVVRCCTECVRTTTVGL